MKIHNGMVLIGSALLAQSASAVVLYDNNDTRFDLHGSIRVMYESRESHKGDRVKFKDNSSRFGFNIQHKLTDNLSAFGRTEWGVNTQSGESNFSMTNRLGYIGLKYDDIGELSFGRLLSPMDYVDHSDFSYVYGGVMWFGGNTIGQTVGTGRNGLSEKNTFTQRIANTAKVAMAPINGFRLEGSYTTQTGDLPLDVDQAYTVAAFYDVGDLNLSAGYSFAKANTSVIASADAPTNEIWGVSAQYTFKPVNVRVGLDFGQTTTKNYHTDSATGKLLTPKANLIGVGASWNYGVGDVYTGYYLRDGNGDSNNYKEENYVVGTVYQFEPGVRRVRVFAEYANLNKSGGTLAKKTSEDAFAVGMRLYF